MILVAFLLGLPSNPELVPPIVTSSFVPPGCCVLFLRFRVRSSGSPSVADHLPERVSTGTCRSFGIDHQRMAPKQRIFHGGRMAPRKMRSRHRGRSCSTEGESRRKCKKMTVHSKLKLQKKKRCPQTSQGALGPVMRKTIPPHCPILRTSPKTCQSVAAISLHERHNDKVPGSHPLLRTCASCLAQSRHPFLHGMLLSLLLTAE